MQQPITFQGDLLNERGELRQAGYATSLCLDYRREQIQAHALRIKEWDYYYLGNQHVGLALTIADNSYMGLVSVSLFDFDAPCEETVTGMTLLPMGKTRLPSSSAFGDTTFHNNRFQLRFTHDGSGKRRLFCECKKFRGEETLRAELELLSEPQDSMVIATPFAGHPQAFYYNQKINCMPVQGRVSVGDWSYEFSPQETWAVLDWGRGVWTYRNTWYWSSLSTEVDGHRVGLNLGYGFGDTSAATENMIFYDGIAHKLDQVRFEIPQLEGHDHFMGQWMIRDNQGLLDLTFDPILDRSSKTSLLVIKSIQHQVFGRFNGTIQWKDGRIISLHDVVGFAEKVYNCW